MSDRRLLNWTLLACFAVVLGSCASQQLEPIPRNSSIRIAIAPDAGFAEDLDYDDTRSENASAGAGAGLLVGSVAAGSACGPLSLLCEIVGGLVGAGVGAATGGIYGAATALNEEEREQLARVFEAVFSTRTPNQYIDEYAKANAKERWRLDSVNADYTITLRFDELTLVQKSTESFAIGLAASLTITDHDLPPDDDSTWHGFQHITPERELDFFLDIESGNFKYEFERGLDVLTNQMVNSF